MYQFMSVFVVTKQGRIVCKMNIRNTFGTCVLLIIVLHIQQIWCSAPGAYNARKKSESDVDYSASTLHMEDAAQMDFKIVQYMHHLATMEKLKNWEVAAVKM